jgi:hypothetical protein
MVLAERKPRPAGNSFDEVTGTFTVRVRTQHVIRELREDPLNDEQRTGEDVKLLFVRANWIECCALNKSAVVFQWEWTLLNVNPKLLEWKEANGTGIATWCDWIYFDRVLHVWISSSIIDTQNNTPFDERLPGSNASCSNCSFVWFDVWPFRLMIESWNYSWFGLFVSLNWI